MQERQLLAPALKRVLEARAWSELAPLPGSIARLFTAALNTYDYSHHASLGCDSTGMYAFWSNGRNGEDLPGQVQSWCRRDETGRWGTPQVLARAPMVEPLATTVINGGTSTGSPVLTAFFSEYKGRPKDGAGGTGKWSLPMVTAAHIHDTRTGAWLPAAALLDDYLLNEGPKQTRSGRWVMTGENHNGHTRIAISDSPQPGDAGWAQVPVAKGEGTSYKNEPSWFQRPDGTLALWLRDDGGTHRLWLAESVDDGASWSVPVPTDIPDATSKCCSGRLSTGLYYLIHNPNTSGLRIPLTLLVSRDGMLFERAYILRDEDNGTRLPGRFKGPGYQYPNALEHDGQLHIIYSVNKEDVEVQSIAVELITL